MYASHVRISDKARRRFQSSWCRSYRELWASRLECWELNLFLLEEQQATLTVEPSPQSLQNSLSHLIWLEFQLPVLLLWWIQLWLLIFFSQEFIFVGLVSREFPVPWGGTFLYSEVGQCSQGAFAFPRAPGTQESFEFAALFGTSIPIWSLKLDPESTCLTEIFFLSCMCLYPRLLCQLHHRPFHQYVSQASKTSFPDICCKIFV